MYDTYWADYGGGVNSPPQSKAYPATKLCSHYRDSIAVGSWTIYVTAESKLWSRKEEWQNEPPDLLIGLTTGWRSRLEVEPAIESWGVPEVPSEGEVTIACPYVIVDWEDRQACPKQALPVIINLALARIQQGQRVEVGCMGAHGRTGTFLACLIGKVEGLKPDAAILAVRKRHCEEAVESIAQIEQIYQFLGSTKEQANKEWERKTTEVVTIPPKTAEPARIPVHDVVISGAIYKGKVAFDYTEEEVDRMLDREYYEWLDCLSPEEQQLWFDKEYPMDKGSY